MSRKDLQLRYFFLGVSVLIGLSAISLFIGVSDVSLASLLTLDPESRSTQVLLVSRIPRTLAVMLAGASMAIAGLVMQMVVRNRFVEPSTVGTVESASLGFLAVTILAPDWPVTAKMLVAAAFALAGTTLFLRILRLIPLRDPLLVPLIGIMLGGVIGAITTFFAYRFDLLASLLAWSMGDFSGILRGRYELLWIAFIGMVLAWFAADRFTVAGLGQNLTTSLGLNHNGVVSFGLVIVSLVTACVVVTVGMVPFLGLIIPNIVSLIMGDNMRRSIPWVAIGGASFVLLCDIFGRVVRAPYEIPISVVVGVVGSAIFIYLLLRKPYDAR